MGKFTGKKESSDDDDGMEVEEQPVVRKLARKKKIVKLREKEGRAMAVEKKVDKRDRKKDRSIKPLLAAKDQKKLRVFKELKQQRLESVVATTKLKMSKGKKRRLEKKQRVEFRKKLTSQLTGGKQQPLSLSELDAELNNIRHTQAAPAKARGPTLVQKSKTANEQVERMRQILNYAQFQKNPLGSIKTHLLTSLKLKK